MTQITAEWLQSDGAQEVCALLERAGHQAWFVGGCVRNALLGAPVADLDISTDARPDVVMSLAKAAGWKAIPTGIDHGTVTVVADGAPYEITTFRKDVATDGRRAVVAFAETLEDDARRRDFTMNALYCDGSGRVADPLGGLPDLLARRLRFIENADRRIKEDYLRILRFFRFHAWYGDPDAGIDVDGLAACAENVEGLATLSRERVGQEMAKLLAARDPAPALASFASIGGLMQVLAGADQSALAVLVHIEETAGLEPDPIRRLALIGGQDVTDSLRLSKTDATRWALLKDGGSPDHFAYHHGADLAIDRLAVEAASIGQIISDAQIERARYAARQVCPVTAADFMPQKQGAALGQALKYAKARWIESGFTLTKDELLG